MDTIITYRKGHQKLLSSYYALLSCPCIRWCFIGRDSQLD